MLLVADGEALVDQVFAVHENGCLLACQSRDESAMDYDLLVGMLTVIRNFLSQAFGGGDATMLRKIDFGDKKMVIEGSDNFYVAMLYHGEISLKVRNGMMGLIRDIENNYGGTLTDWDGNIVPLLGMRKLFAPLFVSGIGEAERDKCPLCGQDLEEAGESCIRCGYDAVLVGEKLDRTGHNNT